MATDKHMAPITTISEDEDEVVASAAPAAGRKRGSPKPPAMKTAKVKKTSADDALIGSPMPPAKKAVKAQRTNADDVQGSPTMMALRMMYRAHCV